MGEYAAKHGPAEKEQVAAKLAQDIQTEQDPLVRIVLIRTLGKIPNETAAAVLYAGIKDPDPEVRMEVCTAWGKRVHESLTKGGGMPPGPTEDAAVQILAGALAGDTNFNVRSRGRASLGRSAARSAGHRRSGHGARGLRQSGHDLPCRHIAEIHLGQGFRQRREAMAAIRRQLHSAAADHARRPAAQRRRRTPVANELIASAVLEFLLAFSPPRLRDSA